MSFSEELRTIINEIDDSFNDEECDRIADGLFETIKTMLKLAVVCGDIDVERAGGGVSYSSASKETCSVSAVLHTQMRAQRGFIWVADAENLPEDETEPLVQCSNLPQSAYKKIMERLSARAQEEGLKQTELDKSSEYGGYKFKAEF